MRRASLYNTFSASLLLVCNACLSSCVSQIPLTKEKPVNNSTYQVEYLFEHEGCKVYRFMDMGHYIYFTNCKGDVTSIESDSVRTVNRISRKPIIIKEQTLDQVYTVTPCFIKIAFALARRSAESGSTPFSL